MPDNHEQVTKDVRNREKPKREKPTNLSQSAARIIAESPYEASSSYATSHSWGHKGQCTKALTRRRRGNQIAKESRRKNRR